MFRGNLEDYLLMIPVLLISLTIHEYSHGYVAYRLGDPTAKNEGRLSLNPFRHLDPVGTIMMAGQNPFPLILHILEIQKKVLYL
jgi:Zn-dependent protease